MDQESRAPEGHHCAKCGATEVMRDVWIKEEFGLFAVIPERPGAMIFRGNRQSPLVASVCGRCGYTELYAENFADLWDAYQKGKGAT